MLPRSYTKLNETSFDTYLECNRLPWYYKVFAILSTWLALAGYVVFALVFTSKADNLQVQKNVLTTLAGVALLIGYTGVVITGSLSHSLLFNFDSVLIPTLTASVMGIFITAMNQGLHITLDVSNQAYIYVPLITASVTTIISAALTVVAYFQLRRIKVTDERRRSHIPTGRHSHSISSSGPPYVNQTLLEYVPDDEAQRRQLLRLLIAKDGTNVSLDGNGSTYKIDIPWENAAEQRPRSGSVPITQPRSKWNISNLMPGRGRKGTNDILLDPRQARREEIERSSMMGTDPAYSIGSGSYPGPVTPPPNWTGQTPIRYA